MKDTVRNEMIVQDVAAAIRARRSPLVLTHRTEHLESLANDLRAVCEVVVLKGGMGKQQRLAASNRLALIPNDQPRIIVGTGS